MVVLVFVAVDFDETTTVAVQSTPGVNPVIVKLLSVVALATELENTVELSESFVTLTDTVTPLDGKAEDTFTTIDWEVPMTAKIAPDPGSTLTPNVIAASVTIGGDGGVGVGVDPSPLLHE